MPRKLPHIMCCALLLIAEVTARGDDAAARRERAQSFHLRAQERTGVLVPFYVYPADIHTNPVYNRMIALKRRYETVPFWVILNPASGPGKSVDANYVKAIDRLQGAGCVVLGYVATNYGKRPAKDVQADITSWLTMYPRTQEIFFDEMIYTDTDTGVKYQSDLNQFAKQAGCWPTVANPGADTPGRYFAADAADVIVIHEAGQWPEETRIHGDYFGGHADYPPFTRAVLVHSQSRFDPKALAMVRKYARWVYVTDDPCQPDKPGADNPWDTLSRHLDVLCDELARRDGRENKTEK